MQLTSRARGGIEEIRRGGDQGKLKQVRKTLDLLSRDPHHPSLWTKRLQKNPAFAPNRGDLWISRVRTGPGGERIVWAYRKDGGIRVEYIGPYLDAK